MHFDQTDEPESDKDWWSDLPDWVKLHINEGIDDEENGRVRSSDEFWDALKNG